MLLDMAGLTGVMVLIWAVKAPVLAESITNPKCSYSVEKIKFGLKIKMINSTPGHYTMYVAEKESSFERKGNVSFPSKNSTHVINRLKPCTEYELNVTFINSKATETPCNKTENKSTTTGMTEQDVKSISCSPGYFCYQSSWDISSLLSDNKKVSIEDFNNGSYRFKHAYDDMCSDLVLKFPPESCSNTIFTVSEVFTTDFIDPHKIKQVEPTKLPAEINAILPSSCKDLSVEYKCSGINNDSVEPSDMKPFTDYSCTGDIKMNNVPINKTTKPVKFNIYCDFETHKLQTSSNSTSIELKWKAISDKCQDVLDKLDELSYSCSCKNYYTYRDHNAAARQKKPNDEWTCIFTSGIKPLTFYYCEVRPSYGDQKYFRVMGLYMNTMPRSYKALIGSLLFPVIFIILCVAFFIRTMRKSRSDDEEQKLFSTVIYSNMSPPKHIKGD